MTLFIIFHSQIFLIILFFVNFALEEIIITENYASNNTGCRHGAATW